MHYTYRGPKLKSKRGRGLEMGLGSMGNTLRDKERLEYSKCTPDTRKIRRDGERGYRPLGTGGRGMIPERIVVVQRRNRDYAKLLHMPGSGS